ncbi:hypothetical protein QTP86_023577, partial [Hemibagrus guttatus]
WSAVATPNREQPKATLMREYKAAKYGLRKAITVAKKQYRENLDSFYSNADAGQMWQGLQHITDYRPTTSTTISSSDSLPDDLNTFYSRFKTSSDNTEALRKINPRNSAGPDNIPGQALRACATELADVLTSNFNLSLSQSTVPTCFKTTTIVPLPKKSPPTCLNDYRPVALTPHIMKCFQRVVLAHIQSSIPDTLDPLQYAYRSNSSAFNMVIPHKLTHKLFTPGLHPTLCDWLLNFLTGRPQSVRIGNRTSATITTNIGTPQGCVLSPILYTLFTHDCVTSHKDNIILKTTLH